MTHERRGSLISLLIQSHADGHYGHTTSYPAGTDPRTALNDLLGNRTLGQKPSEEEMARRAAVPFEFAGVQFHSYEDASSAIRRFGEIYADIEFQNDEEIYESFRASRS